MFSSINSTGAIYLIILLRHGESVGNAEGYHQGQSDFPLTPTGLAQARSLAARWKSEGVAFDRIISSPLQRARQTAEIVSASMNRKVEFDTDWMERDNGLLSGIRHEESARIYPRPPFIHVYQGIGGTGESQWELYLRTGHALQRLVDSPPGRYLIVSHGGTLNMAMYAILGIPPQANFTGPRFRFGNTSFATLTYTPNEHKWTLICLNDRAHWKETEKQD